MGCLKSCGCLTSIVLFLLGFLIYSAFRTDNGILYSLGMTIVTFLLAPVIIGLVKNSR